MNSSIEQPAGNYYDKYKSRNPIVRWMMAGFTSSFESFVEKAGVERVLEIGCGEAELSILMAKRGLQVTGCDIAVEAIEEAEIRVSKAGVDVDLHVKRIEDFAGDSPSRAPLVVCCEVLEHLDDPDHGLDILAELADPWLLCSVPREPLWRVLNMARGKYIREFGNTPGHVNH